VTTSYYAYVITLTVTNYVPDSSMVIVTDYDLPGDYLTKVAPSKIAQLIEQGNDIEFEIHSLNAAEDELKEGFYPVMIAVKTLTIERDVEGFPFGTIGGEITLIDSLPLMPMKQTGDVYDNLLEAGFEIVASRTTLDKNKNALYDRLLEKSLGSQ